MPGDLLTHLAAAREGSRELDANQLRIRAAYSRIFAEQTRNAPHYTRDREADAADWERDAARLTALAEMKENRT